MFNSILITTLQFPRISSYNGTMGLIDSEII